MSAARLAPLFRVLHWGVALTVLLNAYVLEAGDPPHKYIGYLCVALVVLRLVLSKKRTVTHYNPKAIYIYGLIWLSIFGLGLTGFMMGLDRFWGNTTLEQIHSTIANVILVLVLIHLIGVFFDAYKHKRRTWMVMITGHKD